MRGLTRSSVKHVYSPTIPRVHQRHPFRIEAVTLTSDGPRAATIQAPATQHIASFVNERLFKDRSTARSRIKSAARADGRYISDQNFAETVSKSDALRLEDHEQRKLDPIFKISKELAQGIRTLLLEKPEEDAEEPIVFGSVLSALPPATQAENVELMELLKAEFSDEPYFEVKGILRKLASHRHRKVVSDVETIKVLGALKLVDISRIDLPTAALDQDTSNVSPNPAQPSDRPSKSNLMGAFNTIRDTRNSRISRKTSEASQAKQSPASTVFGLGPNAIQRTLDPRELKLQPLEVEGHTPHIPELSFDLSRVLFNPGIYQLQDPRSRVFNFDPYLAQPMPISEFNFGALNEYITSSKDETLLAHAQAQNKRYIGSSSSMSAALCQFHFLISQFREINTANVTRGFDEGNTQFTMISRAPAAIFLRWKNGVYAIDADKEYDEPNVLMSLGKSLEKFLTLDKSEFEKWRKTGTPEDESFSDANPEAYHYSTQGDFLLRSQLDAKDARLPGTGVFDLKTRAVAGIRMNVREHEVGMGYQIKDRFGTWESFEREYYDMMRSAFLKYSMQVRMGNMDGIFVAYHNIARLFGFQYIPVTELDLVLHGQSDPAVGDQEFRMSIDLINQLFDMVTAKFPEQSIRFHFETREPAVRENRVHMNIFAEPMTDKDINDIQARQDTEFAEFEKKVAGESKVEEQPSEVVESSEQLSTRSASTDTGGHASAESALASQSSDSIDANPEVLDRVLQRIPADTMAPEPRPLAAFRVTIKNKVNDIELVRPQQITDADHWSVDVTIDEIADETARKMYIQCKNRRMSALKTTLRQNQGFLTGIHNMSRSGAVWRQEQDEIDAARDRVVLYPG